MNQGCIRLFRALLDSRVWRKHNALRVWIWCLFKANHKNNHIQWVTGKGSTVVTLLPGQFVTGRYSGSVDTGLAPSTWRDAMKFLEKEQMVNLKSEIDEWLMAGKNKTISEIERESEDYLKTKGGSR